MGVNDGLSDVLMLVSWDMDSNKVDLISIPRDTYYERDGYTSPSQKKINAAYASDKGVIATANAVSDVLMGIPINYYAIIDYDAVESIVTIRMTIHRFTYVFRQVSRRWTESMRCSISDSERVTATGISAVWKHSRYL